MAFQWLRKAVLKLWGFQMEMGRRGFKVWDTNLETWISDGTLLTYYL
jgi:hypothetical protein